MAFHSTEGFFTQLIKDFIDGFPVFALDPGIHVDKGISEPPGQPLSDC
jgi:hypothetical protein